MNSNNLRLECHPLDVFPVVDVDVVEDIDLDLVELILLLLLLWMFWDFCFVVYRRSLVRWKSFDTRQIELLDWMKTTKMMTKQTMKVVVEEEEKDNRNMTQPRCTVCVSKRKIHHEVPTMRKKKKKENRYEDLDHPPPAVW